MDDPTEHNPTRAYIIAVIIMAMLGVMAILVLTIMRPKEDNIVVITLILGFLAPTTLSLLSFMKSQEAAVQVKETHKIVNSELEKRVVAEKGQSRLEGIQEGEALVIQAQGTPGVHDGGAQVPPAPPAVGFKMMHITMKRQ